MIKNVYTRNSYGMYTAENIHDVMECLSDLLGIEFSNQKDGCVTITYSRYLYGEDKHLDIRLSSGDGSISNDFNIEENVQ